jgi:hypothetical protein
MIFVRNCVAALLLSLPAGAAFAACVQPVTSPLQAQIDSVRADPKAFFAANPVGGGAMVRDVRNIVAGDASLAKILAEMARQSPLEQKVAIGAGLGQAARICERVDPQAANQIQQAVASAADLALASEFLNVIGSTATAATTGAPGGAPAGAPAGGPVGTGAPTGGITLQGGGRTNAGSFPGNVSSSVSLTRTGAGSTTALVVGGSTTTIVGGNTTNIFNSAPSSVSSSTP